MIKGGPADHCGKLYRGDQIIAVNNVSVLNATHEEAAATLKGSSSKVNLKVQYKPDEYRKFEEKIASMRDLLLNSQQTSNKATFKENQLPITVGTLKTSQKKSFYVRTLFDYDPSKGKSVLYFFFN